MARRKGRKTSNGCTRPKKEAVREVDFEEAVELFLAHNAIRGLSVRTRQWHLENLTALRKTLVQEGKDYRPSSITGQILKTYFILPMVKRGLKTNTINGRVRSARAFFTFLFEEGYISSNPAAKIENLKREKPLIETFTRKQVKDLLNAPDQETFTGFRDHVMLSLLLETGIRVAEAAGLRVDDVLFEEGTIRISRGKGAKGRVVPFQSKLKGLLIKYLRERGEVYHPYLFINRDEKPLKVRTIQERLTVYGKAAGIKGVRCSPHIMRHTFAKFYIIAGGDIFSLQKILGHSSLEMVRYYVELFGSEVKEQHRKYSPLRDFE